MLYTLPTPSHDGEQTLCVTFTVSNDGNQIFLNGWDDYIMDMRYGFNWTQVSTVPVDVGWWTVRSAIYSGQTLVHYGNSYGLVFTMYINGYTVLTGC